MSGGDGHRFWGSHLSLELGSLDICVREWLVVVAVCYLTHSLVQSWDSIHKERAK